MTDAARSRRAPSCATAGSRRPTSRRGDAPEMPVYDAIANVAPALARSGRLLHAVRRRARAARRRRRPLRDHERRRRAAADVPGAAGARRRLAARLRADRRRLGEGRRLQHRASRRPSCRCRRTTDPTTERCGRALELERRSGLPAPPARTGRRIHTRFVTPRRFLRGLGDRPSDRQSERRSAAARSLRLFVDGRVLGRVLLAAVVGCSNRAAAPGRARRRSRDPSARHRALRLPARGDRAAARASISSTRRRPSIAQLDHIMPQVASMGAAVAVADFDRDGWQDFYVTNSGEGSLNRLYRNQGDGTFSDVAAGDGRRRRQPARAPACRWARSGATTTTTATRICSSTSTAGRSCFTTSSGRGFIAVSRARRPAALGQRQQRHLARLRPRRPARSLRRRLLARGRRPLAPDDDADHAGELRVREERRAQVSVPQPRRRHVRETSPRRSGSTAAAGRWPSAAADCCGTGYPDLFLANDYGVSRAVRQPAAASGSSRSAARPASAARRRAA